MVCERSVSGADAFTLARAIEHLSAFRETWDVGKAGLTRADVDVLLEQARRFRDMVSIGYVDMGDPRAVEKLTRDSRD